MSIVPHCKPVPPSKAARWARLRQVLDCAVGVVGLALLLVLGGCAWYGTTVASLTQPTAAAARKVLYPQ